ADTETEPPSNCPGKCVEGRCRRPCFTPRFFRISRVSIRPITRLTPPHPRREAIGLGLGAPVALDENGAACGRQGPFGLFRSRSKSLGEPTSLLRYVHNASGPLLFASPVVCGRLLAALY